MPKSPIEVVVIDDLMEATAPLIIRLRMFFESVMLRKTPGEGIEYVLENLGKKRMVVVLDLEFFSNKHAGHQIFETIRKKSHILPFVIFSATDPSSQGQDLTDFINEQAFAFHKKGTPASEVVDTVKRAADSLSARVDAAIESWIESHPPETREQPYITTANGETISLENILQEIRLQTEKGKEFERRFLMLTVDLVMRNIENING
ncbi:hypothetical protein [Hymenobacter convexus]|uniref:hypothetical protein n=1 Tax=Hymenobacter sp. CA1UV-4 TaxID=3063782 RepID=UPI00271312E2|nr:hypothetical protein [Hymenobacter sp. CA1UV-4]MDO7851372.1 hypothetical protein [Hymenobacter sp. CA1UV-4]